MAPFCFGNKVCFCLSIIHRFWTLGIIWLGPFWGIAQDLCNTPPAGFTRFTPTVNQTTICSGETVTFDVTGISNFTIYQGYQNQTFSQLSSLPQTTLSSVRLSNPDEVDRIVTLLLVGQRGTANIIGCINITVRPIRTPQITYEGCAGDVFLFLDDPTNLALGRLRIDWGDGRTETVDPRTQPIAKQSFSTIVPTRIFRISPVTSTQCGREALIEVSMLGRDNYSILTDLTQDPAIPTQFTLNLNQGSRPAARGDYGLYIRKENEQFPNIGDFHTIIQPGENTISVPDEGPYCFVAYRNSFCPNNISNEICQIKLDQVEITSPSTNQVLWSHPSPSQITGLLPSIGLDTRVRSSVIIIRKFESKTDIALNKFTETTQGSGSPSWEDRNAVCQKEPCYQIVWRTEGILKSFSPFSRSNFTALSYSNILCVDRATLPKPPAPDVRVSVVSNQQVHVYADKPTTPWPFELVSFDIQDKINGINQFPWIDPAAQPAQASFCYQVRVQDECLIYSEWSEPACTIHLQSLPTNELIWSPQSPFQPGEIDVYAIFYSENTKNGIEAQFTPVVNRHFPDLNPFEEFADYRIEAISTTGRASYSNTIRIPLQFKMFVPTAFSPNGDGVNDTWGPKGRLIRLVRFDMVVAARTGQIMWQSNDPKASWDGTYQGQPAPAGSYSFQISAETTSETIQKSGVLQLIR